MPRYAIHDVLTAYNASSTPIIREAMRRWLSEFVAYNHQGFWHDDPVSVRLASIIVMSPLDEAVRVLEQNRHQTTPMSEETTPRHYY